jgi:hypothetical protein
METKKYKYHEELEISLQNLNQEELYMYPQTKKGSKEAKNKGGKTNQRKLNWQDERITSKAKQWQIGTRQSKNT